MSDNEKKHNEGLDKKKPFFSVSDDNATASYGESVERPGVEIGPYKLLSVLGEGGFGIVYLAEQRKPIKRRVALKIVKPGMDSKEILARFEAERQTLALLDHPNIAKIHDAGMTKGRRPYFVMEYVKGTPITEYCDRHKLTIETRLKLFQEVCSAIQYAHQKGIIHRDIKPSNILISTEEKQSLPKVIDFGIAKAQAQSLTDRTLFTEVGQVIGTPEYMSPEQVEMNAEGIDTRSDVYSLGVVFYELLVGVLPFTPETLRAKGIDAMRRVILDEEPRTPSTRLTSLGEEAKEIAQKRQSDFVSLARCLRRELEWIPLMAMRKERARRYQSASEFSQDIQNYLDGIPLMAGPESVSYRLDKFVRRHAGTVFASATIVVLLIAGLIVSTRLYINAESMRVVSDEAKAEAIEARDAEKEQRQLAETERNRALTAEQESKSRLVNLYEEQGRKSIQMGQLDEALIYLNEAYQLESDLPSIRFLLTACFSQHSNPVIRAASEITRWEFGYDAPSHLPHATSSNRELVAFSDAARATITVFETRRGTRILRIPNVQTRALTFVPGGLYLIVKVDIDRFHHKYGIYRLDTGKLVTELTRNTVDVKQVFSSVPFRLPKWQQLETLYSTLCINKSGSWLVFPNIVHAGERVESELKLWDFENLALHTASYEGTDSLLIHLAIRYHNKVKANDRFLSLDLSRILKNWSAPSLDTEGGFRWNTDSGLFGGSSTFITLNPESVLLSHRTSNFPIKHFPDMAEAAYSPDGSTLITKAKADILTDTGPGQKALIGSLWRAIEGERIVDFTGSELVNWHFTPDASIVILEQLNGQITAWRTADGSQVMSTPLGQRMRLFDVSTNSTFVVLGNDEVHTTGQLWDLHTGDVYGAYGQEGKSDDLSVLTTLPDLDRVFACSRQRPTRLLRFNGDGSALITAAGLQWLKLRSLEPGYVQRLVLAHVPKRMEDGKIRATTEEEMLLAKYRYLKATREHDDPEMIHSVATMIKKLIQLNELEQAFAVVEEMNWLMPKRDVTKNGTAFDVVRQIGQAYHARAELKTRQHQYRDAVVDYDRALRCVPNDPNAPEELAWLQATCPEPNVQDYDSALRASQKACELTDWQHWDCLSTYATACAAAGNYSDAVSWQRKAIERLPIEEIAKWKVNFQNRLNLFEIENPYSHSVFRDLPTENLIGWWKLDEGEGRVAHDSSGNRNDCQFVGNPEWVSWRTGTALQCSADHCAACPDRHAFSGWDTLTACAWVRVEGSLQRDNWAPIVQHETGAWRILYRGDIDKFCFDVIDLVLPDDKRGPAFLEAQSHVEDSRWYHLACVYDGFTLELYVNGILNAKMRATGALAPRTGKLQLGGGADSFAGLLDDVRIYCEALEPEVIAELFAAGHEKKTDSLIARVPKKHTTATVGDHVPLESTVVCTNKDNELLPFDLHWNVTKGPGEVQFIPNQKVVDPCALFSEPGLYQLLLCAETEGSFSSDSAVVFVYPRGFDGLLVHYHFNQGNAHDSASLKLHGQLVGNARIISESNQGMVIDLDGKNDFIDCGNHAAYTMTGTITVSAWIKVRTFDKNYQAIVTKGNNSWRLHRYRGDTLQFACTGLTVEAAQYSDVIGNVKVNDGKWHHAAGVYDGVRISLYIDGKLDNYEDASGQINANDHPVLIGENAGSEGREWNGLIDDVRIYNRGLAEEEIKKLFDITNRENL